MEGFRQVEGGFVERQAMDGGPKVEDIALSAAAGLGRLKDVLAEMRRESGLRAGGRAVDGTRSAALQAAAAQVVEQAQVFENLLQRYLLTEEGEVDLGTNGTIRGRRWLDERRRRRYGSIGRGDHFLCGQLPFVAHGCFIRDDWRTSIGR